MFEMESTGKVVYSSFHMKVCSECEKICILDSYFYTEIQFKTQKHRYLMSARSLRCFFEENPEFTKSAVEFVGKLMSLQTRTFVYILNTKNLESTSCSLPVCEQNGSFYFKRQIQMNNLIFQFQNFRKNFGFITSLTSKHTMVHPSDCQITFTLYRVALSVYI